MSRKLIEQVLEIKRTLYKQQYEAKLKKLTAKDEFDYCPPGQDQRLKEKLYQAESAALEIEGKLNRAKLFGLHHTKGSDFPCIHCFVDHGVLISMTKIEPKIIGTKMLKCTRCDRELTIDA
jgi:hypothetical protein